MVIFDSKKVEVNTCHMYFWENQIINFKPRFTRIFSSISKIFSHCVLHKIATSAKTINNGLVL